MATSDDAWGPPFDVKPEEITFESGGVTISATKWERPQKPVEPPAEGKKPKKIKEGDPEAPPRSWCILVHGLLSDRREFGDLPKRLARLGYGVVAMDVRGHGKSGGPKGVYDVDKAVEDVKALQQWLHREEQWDLNPQQWAVIGHSMGSMVALKMGPYLHAGDLVVAAAPMHSVLGNVNAIKRWGYGLAYQMTGKTNGDSPGPTLKYEVSYKDIFQDKAAAQKAREQGFLQTRIPIRNYPLFKALDGDELARQVGDATALVVVAEKDRVVQKWSSRQVYDALTTAKTWMEIPGSGHSMFLDATGPTAIKQVVDWLDYRLGSFNEVRPGSTKRLD